MSEIFYSKMMEKIEDRNCCFVFPSEIVRQRATHFALQSGVKAIESDRFLSWDQFKMKILSIYDENDRPLSQLDSLFFCYEVIEANKNDPLFKQIIPQEFYHYSENFIENLRQAVSSLFLLEADFEGLVQDDLLTDLRQLKKLYDAFLKKNNLYEIEPPQVIDERKIQNKIFYLFFPDLYLDIHSFKKILKEGEKRGFFVLIGEKEALKKEVEKQISFRQQFYLDGKDEVKALFEKIQTLSGKRGEIIITVADEALLPLLRYYAPLYDIPLEFKKGDLLANTKEGSFFAKVVSVIKQDFQFEAVRDLILNHYPLWKPNIQKKLKEILFIATEGCILKGESAWANVLLRFSKSNPNGAGGVASVEEKRNSVFSFWDGFSLSMKAVASASTLSELNFAIKNFIKKYIDDETMAQPNEKGVATPQYRRFQMVLSSINELIAHEEKLYQKNRSLQTDPFSFWFKYLSMKLYVPPKGEGIPIYPYRVGAGGFYDYHFICGLSAKSASVIQENTTLLGESEKALWLEKQTEEKCLRLSCDFTQEYLQAYQLSGKEVFISGSAQIGESFHIVPSYWYIRNAYQEILHSIEDPLEKHLEEKATPLAPKVYQGFQQYALVQELKKNKPYLNYITMPIQNSDLLKSLESLFCQNGKFSFSTTSLENFRKCPWRGILSRLLGEPLEKKPQAVRSTARGIWLHGAIQDFFEYCKSQKDFFLYQSLEDRKKIDLLKKERIKKYFDDLEKEEKEHSFIPIPAIWNILKSQLIQIISNAIDDLFEKFMVIDLDQCEKEIVADFGEYSLKGRIDSLFFDSQKNPFIIDYKNKLSVDAKNLIPKKSFILSTQRGCLTLSGQKEEEAPPLLKSEEELFSDPDGYFPTSFQMAVYQELAKNEDSQKRIYPAYFYNFSGSEDEKKEKKSIVCYPKDFFDEKKGEPFPLLDESIRILVHLFAKRVIFSFKTGNFTLWENPDCTYCPYKSICKQNVLTKE